MRILANGNVGIGTTSPDYKLQVSGTIAPEGNEVNNLGSSTNRFNQLWTKLIYDINEGRGLTNQILTSTGSSGIAWVDASTVIGGPYLPLTGGTLSGNLTITKSSAMMKVSEAGGGDIRMVAGGSTGYVGTYNNTSMQILQNGSNAIFIDTSKNIGIGTTSPGAKLEVSNSGSNGSVNENLLINMPSTSNYVSGTGNTIGFKGLSQYLSLIHI